MIKCLILLLRLTLARASSAAVSVDGTATEPACVNSDENCVLWAEKGECKANPAFMRASCRASCYVCQSDGCRDEDGQCEAWAANGECARNEAYMLSACPYACRTCFVNTTATCRRPADTKPAAVAGSIDERFEALVRGPLAPRVLHREPWLLEFDSFLTEEEADHLLAVAGHHFEESRFLGDDKVAAQGLVRNRTSTTSWCNVPSCVDDAGFVTVRQRISDLMGVPWEHSEHLQLLRYEEGQFYREHHDQISPPGSAWGARLYTFFMYLSDVEAGGETTFTRLNLTVPPRKGNAILWPSVLSSDPTETDERTFHEALPVVRGTKFAANFWIHAHDFQSYHAKGCDNRNYLQDDVLPTLRARYE
jgi:hypothetical protein